MFDFSQNYFQLFNLDTTFEIDTALLNQRYRDIQHQIHPDRFAGKGDQDQRLAVQFAAFINGAFQCLKQPLERAKYLLKLKGVDINLDSQSHFDNAFLMTQIELREQLENVTSQKQPQAAMDQLQQQVVGKIDELAKIFVTAYGQGNDKQAIDAVVKWQFLAKLQRDIQVLEDSIM